MKLTLEKMIEVHKDLDGDDEKYAGGLWDLAGSIASWVEDEEQEKFGDSIGFEECQQRIYDILTERSGDEQN